MKRLLPMLLLAAAAPQDGERIAAGLAAAHPGARFGLVVADADGREIVALLPDQRFVPASNTKMFTTAALFASGMDLDTPDAEGGAAVRLEPREGRAADVVLVGHASATASPRLPMRSRRRRVGSATWWATTAGSRISGGAQA
jgi:D-alanyl-D-alanine carboxypeptidase/D-alanyl-D-alanine-endopeptidase (penicillin-binding protein 4)